MTIDQLASLIALQSDSVIDRLATRLVDLDQTRAEWLARSIQIEVMDRENQELESEGRLYDEF